MPPPQGTLRVKKLESATTSSQSLPLKRDRRAYVSPDFIRSHKLAAGDWIVFRSKDEPASGGTQDQPIGWIAAQLWPRVGQEDDTVMLSSSQMANIGSTATSVNFQPLPTKAISGVLKEVTVKETDKPGSGSINPSSGATGIKRETEWRRAAIKEALISVKYLGCGHKVTLWENGPSFVVSNIQVSTKATPSKIGFSADNLAADLGAVSLSDPVYEVRWGSQIVFEDQGNSSKDGKNNGVSKIQASSGTSNSVLPPYITVLPPAEQSDNSYGQLGGLDAQIRVVKDMLNLPLNNPEQFARFGLKPPRGLLLHGPPGTGKTALASAIASATPGCSCIVVNGPELSSAFHGETEERLREVFEVARQRSPCIIVLDEVDALCPRRDGGEGGEVERRVVAMLLTLMDGMSSKSNISDRVVVVASTNRPNSIDPALRRPGRFDREIEIGIPDAPGRKQILDVKLAGMPHSLTSAEVQSFADRTHGYVGADLSSLVVESAMKAIQRSYDRTGDASKAVLTYDDMLAILPSIRPSAMREVFVETPEVRWTDIGGQEEVKQKLRECVEWPLTHQKTFKLLGVEPPRGVLLYGPPGCSKTMTAKALATESGINFLAVKGPELLNKYVGESERAVREVFRKARAASPSIVFFDEIDALGSSRDGSEGGASHGGVLTTLLNEMDGIEQLSGVTVVAATNRPDVLDTALTRPGRLDRILYVGAPDFATRKAIFQIKMKTMSVEPGVDLDELARITDGCSGAEIISVCQDAALTTMNEDLDAKFVKKAHLIHSAQTVRRRITPEMVRFFEQWRDQSGIRSA